MEILLGITSTFSLAFNYYAFNGFASKVFVGGSKSFYNTLLSHFYRTEMQHPE